MGTDGSRKLCYHQIIVGGATRKELQQTVCALVNFGQAEVVQWACWLAGRPARLTPDHFGLFTHSKSATKDQSSSHSRPEYKICIANSTNGAEQ